MRLTIGNAEIFHCTVSAVSSKLKTVSHFSAVPLSESTTFGTGFTLRTEGFALRDANIEGFNPVKVGLLSGWRTRGASLK
jgi:hypothetical protein